MKTFKYIAGEWVSFYPEERQEAEKYLELWEKFSLRKLEKDCCYLEVVRSEIIERDPHIVSVLAQMGTLGKKLELHLKIKFDFEHPLLQEVE